MLARKIVHGFLIVAAIVGMGLVFGHTNESKTEDSIQVATRYHARNRTATFFERFGAANARNVVTITKVEAKPVYAPARSLRRR